MKTSMNMLAEMFKAFHVRIRPHHRSLGYGRIETSIFHYITPQMLVCIAVPAGVITYAHTLIARYYLAGVLLNSIIISVFLVGITRAILNNIAIYRGAKFLSDVGACIDKGKPTPEDVAGILKELRTKGKLFDTNHMEGCIKSMERFGHPNFTDADARMIKGKLGQRIGESRKNVSFIGGLLVMLGLIGTYTGLLRTVDTVGAVMMKMSHIGDAGADAMSGFIGALAEPLQGMGLAFSASLFGISGSVLISVFALFCNGAQSEFIENVSRWIDDRIPKFAAAAKGSNSESLGKAASAEDLRTWLAGFVNLSVKTNHKLNQLVGLLAHSSAASVKTVQAVDQLIASQRSSQALIEAMSSSMTAMAEHQQRALEVLSQSGKGALQMQRDIADLKSSAHDISAAIPAAAQALTAAQGAGTTQAIQHGFAALEVDLHAQTEGLQAIGQSLRLLPTALNQLNHTQNALLERLDKLQATPAPVMAAPFDAFSVASAGGFGDTGGDVDLAAFLKDIGSSDDDLLKTLLGSDEGQAARVREEV